MAFRTGRLPSASVALLILLSVSAAPMAGAAPAFHRAIRVRPAQVSGGPLTNYPFLFNSTDGALRHTSSGGNVRSLNGWDIIFATTPVCADSTTCGGNKLDHEIERYNPATGELVAWVRLPSINNGTAFYIHYGDTAVTASTENRLGVWDANYQGVWHLSEAPANGASGGHIDSKHNTTAGAAFNNGTPQGFTAAPSSTNAAGIAAGADRFYRPVAGSDVTNNDTINVTDHASLEPAGDMTLETWVNAATLPAVGSGDFHLLAQKNYLTASPWNSYQLFFRGDAGAVQLWFGWTNTTLGAYYAVNAGPFAPATWYHVAGVLSGNTVTLYVNGSAAGTTTATKAGTLLGTTDLLSIGNGQAPNSGTDGILDEVRLSSSARSAGWLLTQYRNVSSPATFYELDADVMQVRSGSYVGNGGSRSITGLGFQPDYVMISSSETWGRNTVVRSSSMTGNVSHSVYYYPYHPLVDRITSLDADGFSVGHPPDHLPNNDVNRGTPAAADPYHCVNHAGVTYYWTAFKAAAGEMKASFYTGNGAATQNVTGVGFQPDYLIVFPNSGNHPLLRTSTMAGDISFLFDGGTGKTQQIIALQADGFQVGQGGLTNFNTNGAQYHYVAWRSTPGRISVGSYAGNGAANRQIATVGFRPELVTITPSDTASPTTVGAWGSCMKPGATGSASDYALEYMLYGSQANTSMIHALEPTGFRVARTTGYLAPVNQSGKTYHWVAFGPLTAPPVANFRSIGTTDGTNPTTYSQGTVTVAAGSTLVTGGGGTPPNWIAANRGRGDKITFDGGATWYTVLAVTSATSLTLTQPFPGNGCAAGGCAYTISRKFATLAAWENCIDGPASSATCEGIASSSLVDDNRREVGIAYKETALGKVRINGSATDALHTITLTADPGNRHLGVAGAGVVVDGAAATLANVLVEDDFVTVEWLEIKGGLDEGIEFQTLAVSPGPANKGVVRNLLVHNTAKNGILVDDAKATVDVYNNIVYSTGATAAISFGSAALTTGTIRAFNNTVYNNSSTGFTGNGAGKITLRNNIAIGNAGSGDYSVAGLNAASSNNLAGNASGTTHSPAGGGLNNVTATASPTTCLSGVCVGFNNITGGSENLHLIVTSPNYTNRALDTGADLSTVMAASDIDGQIRVAPWDVGADDLSGTTEVSLQSFVALAGDASVALEWRTASELHNLGFHLYRGLAEGGPWTRITASLIPGLGSSAVGQAYSFRDAGLVNGTRYFYRLEDVDASSKATSHGPVSAVPTPGARASDDTSGGAGGKTRGSAAASCPEWVVSAYAGVAGGDAGTAGLVCTRHGDPEAVSLELVSRDARQATLELRTGGFYALHEASGRVRVFVPGFDFPQDEAATALPLRRALVDAVVGRRVQLAGVRALELASFPGLVPSGLGRAEMEVSRDGTVRAGRRAPQALAPRLVSADLVRLLPPVFQGEAKSAVVEIRPLRFDARRDRLLLAKRVRLRLLFTGRDTGESGRGTIGRRPAPRKPATGEVLARLFTTRRGLYAASFERLFPGRRLGLLASQLRLERDGEPHAFHLEPASGAFGPGGVLYFHADSEAASTDFSSETAFELVLSREGVSMPTVSAAPAGAVLATDSIGSARFETNRFYQPGLLAAPDLWLWEHLASGATRTKSFALAGVSGSGLPAELEVFVQGASESGAPVDHHLAVALNGVPLGEAQFAGKKPHRIALEVPAAVLREGANELALTSLADTGATSYVFLDRFALAYRQSSSLVGGVFEGRWSETGTAALAPVTAPVALLDVTASPAGAARWLTGYEASGGSLRFRAEEGHRYLVVSEPSLLVPRIAVPTPSGLRSTQNRADYLLIAPRAFLAAAEPLVQRRQDQGLATRAVAFEEIADAFGHGRPSAEALKDFLAYAFQSWARPSPRYVLLLGDASYDPRNFTGTAPPAALPALWTRTSYLWTASDPLLAAVNGEDSLPDLALGRLPAATADEAARLVAKLLAWEDSGQGLAGRPALVADNPDLGGDFEADVRDVAASFLADRDPQLLLLSELGAGARPSIRAALDSGLGLLSYVGHGGAAVWASENVWNTWDAASLQAQSRQPLLLTLNCLNGYFVAPSFDSLAESLLKAEGRGAIAAVSPSGLSLDGPAHQYHRALMAEITSGRHARLGDAVLSAQRAYSRTGLMPELLSVYHLLGDPATTIR